MEPMRHQFPREGFLENVRQLASDCGAVLIFDEVTSGWRSHHGGIHLQLGVAPDIAVFAKSISNGFPMAAIIGSGVAMEAAQFTFVSSTYWTEGIGPAAALATIKKLREVNVVPHLRNVGEMTREGWRKLGEAHGLKLKIGGLPALCTFEFDHGDDSRALMTLFTQEMLAHGFLASGVFYPTWAHKADTVAAYLEAVAVVFAWLRERIEGGEIHTALRGPIVHTGFDRLT
jgi:glutamate-1-semialdehyde aminotransferase